MADEIGGMALQGSWEWIESKIFNIEKDATLSFKGFSCSIKDDKGNTIDKYDEKKWTS